MLLNNAAALGLAERDKPWAAGRRTRLQASLFEHITAATSQ
jgi:hypothetical protein